MDRLMWGGEEFHRLFNCSFYAIGDVPLDKRRDILRGIFDIVLCIIPMILYMPCLVSILNRREHTCYKYMFAMGVLDMIELFLLGILSGIFQIVGAVYCSSPTTMYILAILLSIFHIAEVNMEMLLAVNRCMYFASPELALLLFPENKHWTWCWALIPIILGILYGMFGALAFFSSIITVWAWNPHFGYADHMHKLYISNWRIKLWSAQNFLMITVLPFVYLIFGIVVWKQTQTIKTLDKHQRSSPKSMFKQVALISFFNCTYSVITICVEHYSGNEFLLLDASIIMIILYVCEVGISAIPPVIYLSLNKSIQSDCRKMMKRIWMKIAKNSNNKIELFVDDTIRMHQENHVKIFRRISQKERKSDKITAESCNC